MMFDEFRGRSAKRSLLRCQFVARDSVALRASSSTRKTRSTDDNSRS